MSMITDMLVFTQMGELEAMGRLNTWCAVNDTVRRQQFGRLDTDNVPGKTFTCEVWGLCGNYFPVLELVEAFPTFGWRFPRDAVLIVNPEGGGSGVYRADRAGFGRVQCPERTDHPLVARLRCERDVHDPGDGHCAVVNGAAYRWTHSEFFCTSYRAAEGR